METNKEKEYSFTECRGIGKEVRITTKESDLLQWQKDILLGEAIARYSDLPDELKDKFKIYFIMND